jgi:hypothetical protein
MLMKKNRKDKDKRDKALMTPEAGKKSNSKTPPDRSGTDEDKNDLKDSDVHGGHGMGNFQKGEEGAQGYGKSKE